MIAITFVCLIFPIKKLKKIDNNDHFNNSYNSNDLYDIKDDLN